MWQLESGWQSLSYFTSAAISFLSIYESRVGVEVWG